MTYHFIDFLKSAVLNLGKEKEDPQSTYNTRGRPNVSIFWSPVKGKRVDEIRRGECREPLWETSAERFWTLMF
jgi:hypothetical protein